MLTTLSFNTATCSEFTHHLQGLSKTDIVDIYIVAHLLEKYNKIYKMQGTYI